MTTRVLIADDQPLIRAGLVALFTAAPGFTVVGEAADGEQAVALSAETRPDVILMDIRMPVRDGIAATRDILTGDADPMPRVIVLTTFDLPEYIYTALSEGASGFLLKDTPPDRIISAVRAIAAGDILLAPAITHRLIETYADQHRATSLTRSRLSELTARETEILRFVAYGLTNREIAGRLVLSEATVKTHVKHLMSKLDLNSRAQAVVVAYESGLVTPRGDRDL
ncbi:DNA-binding response regulator [Sphaerisporangium siamense]|uniref:DNA-binding NarL/FixJ family response regulator n=1 Tax=Sphaerisporangium siamense TaxID=795645 RepID=A0A7W7D6U9_9ACTN|nr:response regulator transcription factor [Sphaerisporangium siamense]MBB4699963.1 DNA-binding NarL/FixJ family response regulator [Sphaerisporangium siamense]GII84718.1 DNA-binding response regulator [Sphaerisporangium siamense]